jgi:hypothetical protein
MKQSSIYGIALIVGSVGGIVTMIFHPTAHDLLTPVDQIARRNEMIAVATHSLALVSFPILVFGFLGLSRRLGLDRALVSAALVAYAFGAVAVICAAVASGLIAPILTREMLTAAESSRQLLHVVFMYNGLLNQGFAKVFVTASSVAVILWSLSILKIDGMARMTGIIGCIVGLASLAAFFAGHLRLNVHGFGLFIFAQSAWSILLGVFLIRSSD